MRNLTEPLDICCQKAHSEDMNATRSLLLTAAGTLIFAWLCWIYSMADLLAGLQG